MDQVPSPIPFEDDTDAEAKRAERRRVQAPVKAAIFLMDHTIRGGAGELGRKIVEMPEDAAALGAIADSFGVVAGWEFDDLRNYCLKIACSVQPAEIIEMHEELERAAALADPSRLPVNPGPEAQA